MRNTQKKGDKALTKALYTFTSLGYDVSLPITESAFYDFIVDVENKLYKVQVKYSSEQDVDLRSIHSNAMGYVVKKTLANAYDWLYVLKEDGEEFLFQSCFVNRRSVRPSDKNILRKVLKPNAE